MSDPLKTLMDLAQFCQDETLRREAGVLELMIVPTGFRVTCSINHHDRPIQKQLHLTDRQIDQVSPRVLEEQVMILFDALERHCGLRA